MLMIIISWIFILTQIRVLCMHRLKVKMLPGRSRRHFYLQYQLQLPFVFFFFLVLYIGENILFI